MTTSHPAGTLDGASIPQFQQGSDYVAAGAFHGAAAWSAYAVMEFVFSSVLFRLTRPYSVFTPWHWKLTALLLLGFLTIGPLLGALAGFLIWRWRNRETFRVHPARVLELAASLSLALAFTINLAAASELPYRGIWLLLAGLAFVILLTAGMRSVRWMDRPGLLTNYWVISVLLLGLGQKFALEGSMADKMGTPVGPWTLVLGLGLLATAGLAIWAGRGGRFAANRWITAGSVALGVGLLISSVALSSMSQAGAHAASAAIATAGRPNLVLIVMDTVRADHVSVLGYERDTTPNLKRLAGDSVVYTNALSASDITITSHASLFTGMYPSWHGAYCQPPEAVYGRELTKEYPTLAEVLRANGYETLGVAANLYLRADFGLERGFDQFRIPRPVPLLADETRHLLRRRLRRGLSFAVDTAQFDRLYSLGEDIDAALFSSLQQRTKPGAPLFVFLNYMDAHFPYVPPAPYNASFPGKRPRITQDDLEQEQTLISHGQGQPAGYRPHCISQYDGGIAYEDAQIGKVIDWLKRESAYDNTMIVVASDHGESFGERHRVGHANSPYQNLLHVPLMIKYPRSAHPGVESGPVSLIDVAPTILLTVQVPVPKAMQGRSLTVAGDPRTIYGETFPCPVMQPPECPQGCAAKAVFDWPMKFVSSSNGKRELFDLSSDPGEQRNLYIQQHERATQMDAALGAWKKVLPSQTRQNKQVDPEKLKQLKGLGYIQ
jgi:arylsulfatase A-like enzyme